jgi:hypothetical protein
MQKLFDMLSTGFALVRCKGTNKFPMLDSKTQLLSTIFWDLWLRNVSGINCENP